MIRAAFVIGGDPFENYGRRERVALPYAASELRRWRKSPRAQTPSRKFL
jgi:hypothetical protein